MWILIFFLIVLFFAGAYYGNHNRLMLDRLTREAVLNTTLIVLTIFTLLMIAHIMGFFPQSVAAPFMMSIYTIIAAFFSGYAIRLYRSRRTSGNVLYQHRSFWIDHAPNILAVILVLYGIYRTAIITNQPVTGIRITSGLSLISFGFFMWTLKAVPEFRSLGVILLDRFIHWKEVISWKWTGESVLTIEFLVKQGDEDERIKQFSTSIPEDERKELEVILISKMEEFEEERRKVLFPE